MSVYRVGFYIVAALALYMFGIRFFWLLRQHPVECWVVFAVVVIGIEGVFALKAERGHDKRKWALDENTGEYKRVAYRRGKHIVVDSQTYNERKLEQLQRLHQIDLMGKIGAFFCVIAAAVYVAERFNVPLVTPVLVPSGNLNAPLGIWFRLPALFGFAGFLGWAVHGFFESMRDIGSPPIAPRGDDILSHNARNDARQPDIDDIERALRAREGGGGGGEPRYKLKA